MPNHPSPTSKLAVSTAPAPHHMTAGASLTHSPITPASTPTASVAAQQSGPQQQQHHHQQQQQQQQQSQQISNHSTGNLHMDDGFDEDKSPTLSWVLLCIFIWYGSSMTTNIINKAFLQVADLPLTLPISQFGGSALIGFLMMKCNQSHVQGHVFLSWADWVVTFLPLGMGYAFSNVLSQVSLERVPVSFTHTVKSTGPIFTVILARLWLRESYTSRIYVSLIPIIFGVGLASLTEHEFDMQGFIAALISTFILSCQQIASKHIFRTRKLHPMNLQANMSVAAFLCVLPIWLLLEANQFKEIMFPTEQRFKTDPLTGVVSPITHPAWTLLFINTLAYYGQNILAFVVMSWVAPLTYSVAGTLKRIFVIIASVVYFGNQISILNGMGIAMSIFGAFYYNQVKSNMRSKTKFKQDPEVAIGNQSQHSHTVIHGNYHTQAHSKSFQSYA
eukprot:TRINITY_DN2916_c0_g1_i3.p1 TRINITY_DN2916_c0_g1~~TRINITY_DN2916_c0_g1_i3.p1  ORF type:complete len:446 (+),score=80.71 TRINITY_DN2916_c0_g1_i3:85-1422(+)